MKRTLSLIGACLAAGSLALAQDSAQTRTHTETTVKQSGPGVDSKTKMESVVGIVKEYAAGKKIKISGPSDKTYTFDLDEYARVRGTVVVGQKAKVDYWKDADGRERVTVISEATESAQEAATMPRSHTEQTVQSKGPGGSDTKVRTETVIGTVKEYEAGKKIVVTGPKGKEYRFDLDENAAVQGAVAVGERVRVTYQKQENGDKVTIVSRYDGKA